MSVKHIRYSITIIIILILVYYITHHHSDFSILGNLSIKDIVISYCLYFLFLIISSSLNFLVFSHKNKEKINKVKFLKIFIIARFLSKIIPQSGNIFMARELKNKFGLDYSKFLERIISFYLIDILFVISLSLIIFLVLDSNIMIGGYNLSILLLSLLTAITISLIILNLYGERFSVTKSYIRKINEIINNTLNILKDYHQVFRILILITLAFIIVNATYATIISGLNIKLNITLIVVFTILFRLSHILNITPGNIGINEFIFAFVGSYLNIGFSAGMLICMIYRFIAYSSIAVYGIVLGGLDLIKNNKG